MDQTLDSHPHAARSRRTHMRDHRYGGPACHTAGKPGTTTTELEAVTCHRCREIRRARSEHKPEWVNYRVHLKGETGASLCRNPLAKHFASTMADVTCCTCKKEAKP
jgi:hypothetical protein